MANSWDDVVGTEAFNKNMIRIKSQADKNNYILNPDQERINKVLGLMTMNFNKHNKYYCPCKQSHPLDVEKDVTCPCPVIDEEIKKNGYCFCRLFFAPEK